MTIGVYDGCLAQARYRGWPMIVATDNDAREIAQRAANTVGSWEILPRNRRAFVENQNVGLLSNEFVEIAEDGRLRTPILHLGRPDDAAKAADTKAVKLRRDSFEQVILPACRFAEPIDITEDARDPAEFRVERLPDVFDVTNPEASMQS